MIKKNIVECDNVNDAFKVLYGNDIILRKQIKKLRTKLNVLGFIIFVLSCKVFGDSEEKQ